MAFIGRFRYSLAALFIAIAALAAGLSVALGVWQSAPRQQTGRELDVAIFGPGYFRLRDPHTDEIYYTRHGRFHVNANNQLAWGTGLDAYLVEPQIPIPTERQAIIVARDGGVRIDTGVAVQVSVGAFDLATFANPDELKVVTPGLLRETPESGAPIYSIPIQRGLGMLQQGWLDSADVLNNRETNWPLVQCFLLIAGIGIVVWEVRRLRRQVTAMRIQLECVLPAPAQDD